MLGGTSLVIRDCLPEEATGLLNLWQQAGLTSSPTDTLEDLRRVISGNASFVLVAEMDGLIIGTVIAAFDDWRANFYRLAVHPHYQRKGIARALVAEGETRLAARGARRITALVEHDHDWAVSFWRAAGYEWDRGMARFVRRHTD